MRRDLVAVGTRARARAHTQATAADRNNQSLITDIAALANTGGATRLCTLDELLMPLTRERESEERSLLADVGSSFFSV